MVFLHKLELSPNYICRVSRIQTLNNKVTAETEYKEAGGQSFMIDVLLESYKKEKHFTYFMEVFYVQI